MFFVVVVMPILRENIRQRFVAADQDEDYVVDAVRSTMLLTAVSTAHLCHSSVNPLTSTVAIWVQL